MSLITPAMPPAILRAFNTGLGDFLSPNDPLWSVLLKRFFALETYSLDLDRFLDGILNPGSSPDPFDQVGWRFLAADGDLYGGCHVGKVQPSLPPKLTGLSRDVEVLVSVEQFNHLNDLDQVNQDNYEPRVLRVPWARFEAFWLHATKGQNGGTAKGQNGGAAPQPRAPAPSRRTAAELKGRAAPPAQSIETVLGVSKDLFIPYIGFIPSDISNQVATSGFLSATTFLNSNELIKLAKDRKALIKPSRQNLQSFVPGLARHR